MQHLALLVQALDPVPSDNDVKAGWGAFGVFALLILAVAFLCWSFVRQMRKVNAADEAGVFDDTSEETGTRGMNVADRNPEQSGP